MLRHTHSCMLLGYTLACFFSTWKYPYHLRIYVTTFRFINCIEEAGRPPPCRTQSTWSFSFTVWNDYVVAWYLFLSPPFAVLLFLTKEYYKVHILWEAYMGRLSPHPRQRVYIWGAINISNMSQILPHQGFGWAWSHWRELWKWLGFSEMRNISYLQIKSVYCVVLSTSTPQSDTSCWWMLCSSNLNSEFLALLSSTTMARIHMIYMLHVLYHYIVP